METKQLVANETYRSCGNSQKEKGMAEIYQQCYHHARKTSQ